MRTLTASPAATNAVSAARRGRRSAASSTPPQPTLPTLAPLSSRPDRAPAHRSSSSSRNRRTLPARRAFGGGDEDGIGAAAVISPSEEEEEEEEEEEAAPLSPLVVVVPPAAASSSSSSENKNKNKRRLGLFVASAALAHPDKAHYGGEDAWFCSPSSGSIGVADGVGGWAESGVCPAEYARELMAAARSAAEGVAPALVTAESLAAARRGGDESGPFSSSSGVDSSPPGVPIARFEAAGGGAPAPCSSSSSTAAAQEAPSSYGEDGGAYPLDSLLSPSSLPPSVLPKRALEAAHAAVRLPGSATACVAALDPETGTLHGVSVGDSALLVVRGGQFVIFRSTPSSHSFDCPRQLAAAPEHVEWSDQVGDGEAFEVEGLEEGDVVLLGTDGVFDNCWAAELLALLPTEATTTPARSEGGDEGTSLSPSALLLSAARDIAEKVVLLAAANSCDETYPSPYAAEAAACGVDLRGGEGQENDAASKFGAAVSSFASRLFGGGGGMNSDDEDEGGAALLGGKLDDITVVVAVVGRL